MTSRYRKISTTIMVALIISISGCATAPKSKSTGAGATVDDSPSWYERTEIQSSLLGAALAGGICAAVGGKTGTCLASAAGGGAVGYAGGEYLNSLRTKYKTKEEQLEAMLSDIQVENTKAEADLLDLQNTVKDQEKQLKEVKQRLRKKTISRDEAKTRIKEIQLVNAKLKKQASLSAARTTELENTYAAIGKSEPRVVSGLKKRKSIEKSFSKTLDKSIMEAANAGAEISSN